jgi:CBS domain-containing protein
MSLERFCRRQPVVVSPRETVDGVAQRMRDEHVGAVVVVDERLSPIGILTDRDIACRVVADHRAPEATRVGDVMSKDLEVLRSVASLDEALFSMRRRGVRRLPIVSPEGHLSGLVALDDLLVLLSAELGQTAGAIRSNEGP